MGAGEQHVLIRVPAMLHWVELPHICSVELPPFGTSMRACVAIVHGVVMCVAHSELLLLCFWLCASATGSCQQY